MAAIGPLGRNRRRTHLMQQEAIDFSTEPQTDSRTDEREESRSVYSITSHHTTPHPHPHTFPSVTGSPALTDP